MQFRLLALLCLFVAVFSQTTVENVTMATANSTLPTASSVPAPGKLYATTVGVVRAVRFSADEEADIEDLSPTRLRRSPGVPGYVAPPAPPGGRYSTGPKGGYRG